MNNRSIGGKDMTDREKLEKVYEFVKARENLFYKPIEDGTVEIGSPSYISCSSQAASFQMVRYFIENLMGDC